MSAEERKLLIDRLVRESGITEAQADELIALLGGDWGVPLCGKRECSEKAGGFVKDIIANKSIAKL